MWKIIFFVYKTNFRNVSIHLQMHDVFNLFKAIRKLQLSAQTFLTDSVNTKRKLLKAVKTHFNKYIQIINMTM